MCGRTDHALTLPLGFAERAPPSPQMGEGKVLSFRQQS